MSGSSRDANGDSAPISSIEALKTRADALYALGLVDPEEAMRRVRALVAVPALRDAVTHTRAGLLIDVGWRAQRRCVVDEGVRLMRTLMARNSRQVDCEYNLANGLVYLADLDAETPPGWFRATHAIRLEARRLLASAGESTYPTLATRAQTNLGNALVKAHRWSEAYDRYVAALRLDRTNAMAAGSAAQLLLWLASSGIGNPRALRAVAARHARVARENLDRAEELGGRAAVEVFAKLPEGDPAPGIDVSTLSRYLRFVARHQLALVPTIEGLDPTLTHWDSLHVSRLWQPIESGSQPPPVLAMINTIKAGYLVARRLVFRALEEKEEQTGYYADTLDYAVYGTDVASLLLAQRSAIDVLDQIAVLLNDYLKIGLDVNTVDFANLWWTDKKRRQAWRPALEEEVAKSNPAVVALGEMAADLSGGFLRSKLDARNSSTHRFIVLHDESDAVSRPCKAIEHVRLDRFANEAIETLKFVRAAILYLIEVITLRERRNQGVPAPLLFIVPHHLVRRDR